MQTINLINNAKLNIYFNTGSDTVILVIPGGGYHHLSTRESIPVADKFFGFGYNTAILYYSVTPFVKAEPLKEGNLAVMELAKAFKNIFVLGFSAGGHLAGLLSTGVCSSLIKGMILCYPVITMTGKTHMATRANFLNNEITKENIAQYSIEKRVNKDTPSCFIWTMKTDETVPYENTLMMIEALNNNHVYVESKIYDFGCHGMALADKTAIKDGDTKYINEEIAKWPLLADEFIKRIISK